MTLDKTQSLVWIMDVQQRLIPHMQDAEVFLKSCNWLVQLANALGVPLYCSEQNPSKLGRTEPEILEKLPTKPFEKQHFSCALDPQCQQAIQNSGKTQIILAGIEAHICVLQTALHWQKNGYRVFVLESGVSANHPHDLALGLQRMQQAGVSIVSQQMVFFEWLQQAETEEFKTLRRQFL